MASVSSFTSFIRVRSRNQAQIVQRCGAAALVNEAAIEVDGRSEARIRR
jgi:hypothetical protein